MKTTKIVIAAPYILIVAVYINSNVLTTIPITKGSGCLFVFCRFLYDLYFPIKYKYSNAIITILEVLS